MDKSSQSHTSHTPWWGHISLIWLLLTPLIVTVYTLLLPISPNDFWYNVRAGAHITTTGAIPSTALFTTSVPADTPYYYQSWLAQILLFKTLENSGLSGIVILRTTCLLATFVLILFTAWRRITRMSSVSSHPLAQTTLARVTALSVLAAFALAASNMDVRPQTFSVPLFALFLLCLFEWPFLCARQRIIVTGILAIAMVLWANLHGAFVTGILLLGIYVGGETLQFWLTRRNKNALRLFGDISVDRFRLTLLLFPVIGLAALINPRGAYLFSYVINLAGLEAGQKYIQEWQAPHWSDWYGALFFLAFATFCGMMGLLVRRFSLSQTIYPLPKILPVGLSLAELLLLIALAAMAFRDIRSIIWFGLCFAPIFAAQTTQLLLLNQKSSPPPAIIPRPAQIINVVLAIFLVAGALPFLPQWRASLPLPPEYSSQFAPTPQGAFPAGFPQAPPGLLDNTTPVKAVEYLAAHPPTGKIWNDFVFGSYLTWATLYEPRLAPHADPRVEMRPLQFWDEYSRISVGPADAAEFLSTHGFSDALLNAQEQSQLIKRLKLAGWRALIVPNRAQGETAILLRQSLRKKYKKIP